MQVTFILSMIFAIVITIFALANSGTVTISFVFKSFELSQAVVILVSAVTGAVVVFLLNLVSKAKSSMKIKALNRQVKELENQLLKAGEVSEKAAEATAKAMAEKEAPAPPQSPGGMNEDS
ncbi:MAG: hypothetical protein AVO33_02460 [delta proteobacterium ML8_F1]|nr:MAG: hypothetical protein AVO33_02460 [delta proteobacterium ML8_F1]